MLAQQRQEVLNASDTEKAMGNRSSSHAELYSDVSFGSQEEMVVDSSLNKMSQIQEAIKPGEMELNTGAVLAMFPTVQQSIKEIKMEMRRKEPSYDTQRIVAKETSLKNEIEGIADMLDRIDTQEDEVDT